MPTIQLHTSLPISKSQEILSHSFYLSPMPEIIITSLNPHYFSALTQLQRVVYPTLAKEELMCEEHFASQYALFPQGQFVALYDGRVVGQGSGFFINFDVDHPQHTFREICAELFFTNHDPDGDYYYGADISVHPDFRRRGIGRRIYDARKELVLQTNRRGIVGGGLIPGYAPFRGLLSPHQYANRVIAGELFDSTLSFQLRMGFQVRDLIPDYIVDSASDNWATLIEWVNPGYQSR